jgi:hypothetical protein
VINCRGIDSCGTCAVLVEKEVSPPQGRGIKHKDKDYLLNYLLIYSERTRKLGEYTVKARAPK